MLVGPAVGDSVARLSFVGANEGSSDPNPVGVLDGSLDGVLCIIVEGAVEGHSVHEQVENEGSKLL